MINDAPQLEGTGLAVHDLQTDADFARRKIHARDASLELQGLARIANAFVQDSRTILQELLEVAILLSGAESAGITLEQSNPDGQAAYQWVATAGKYAPFLDAVLPAYPRACSVCIERSRPQLFTASQQFFDLMHVEAALVTDGLLIPWSVDGARGTVWIMAHDNESAFDFNDVRLMQVLADFAALGIRQRRQQELLLETTRATTAAATAHTLAHKIYNPLQSLTNCIFVWSEGLEVEDPVELRREVNENLERLTSLTRKLLALPI